MMDKHANNRKLFALDIWSALVRHKVVHAAKRQRTRGDLVFKGGVVSEQCMYK